MPFSAWFFHWNSWNQVWSFVYLLLLLRFLFLNISITSHWSIYEDEHDWQDLNESNWWFTESFLMSVCCRCAKFTPIVLVFKVVFNMHSNCVRCLFRHLFRVVFSFLLSIRLRVHFFFPRLQNQIVEYLTWLVITSPMKLYSCILFYLF